MPTFEIKDCVAFVTGTNKPNGIGRAILEDLIKEGAKKVYATARDKAQLDELVAKHNGKVVAVSLDVTNSEQCAALGKEYPDVNLVVNNAGFAAWNPALGDSSKARMEMDINYFGPMEITTSFAPVLKEAAAAGKPTAVVTVASIASQVCFPPAATYSASKAAAWMLVQGIRLDLKDALSMGVFPGPIETDMTTRMEGMEKSSVAEVASEVMEGLKKGSEEVFTDKMAKDTYAAWKADHKAVERQFSSGGEEEEA